MAKVTYLKCDRCGRGVPASEHLGDICAGCRDELASRYLPTGRKSGEWTEVWSNQLSDELKVVELESGIPYRVVPQDGTPSFTLTMEEYQGARKEGIAL